MGEEMYTGENMEMVTGGMRPRIGNTHTAARSSLCCDTR